MIDVALPEMRLRPPARALATGRGVHGLPGLATLLDCPVTKQAYFSPCREGDVVLAWGHRPSARKAERLAVREGLPLWRLEDGFLRSIQLGDIGSPFDVAMRRVGWDDGNPPLSLVVDDLGIHYDATAPSRVESWIAGEQTAAERRRSVALTQAWRAGRVSKYNHARDYVGRLPDRYVLVVDQTRRDPSIQFGLADAGSFRQMLEVAREENPDCTVLLKVHPQVWAGRRKGHFDLTKVAALPRVQVLGEDVHPVSLIERAEIIYTVTSQLGFEGLLWGKTVRTFGMPFYAGWGLTRDHLPAPARRHSVPLENLVHGALIDYARYLDPETRQRCEVERVLEWMTLQRRFRERFPHKVYATGFSSWKKPFVRAFLAGSRVSFSAAAQIPSTATTVVTWGDKPLPAPLPLKARIIRLEDGFLRSVGLGADLIRPLSWVADSRGMYYDSTSPSDLEEILQTVDFPGTLVERAMRLRERIVTSGVTKYNVGGQEWRRPVQSMCVILVPGQVESDASIRLGSPTLRTNLALLRAVREQNPQAHVLYKPHPDVVAGLRQQGADESEISRWCDEIVVDVPMDRLLAQVDEVHVLTSLAGFEALLRDKPVTCYGQPFYSGWGLTRDLAPLARRNRRLKIDQLVAGALICYPTYLSRTTDCFTTPERILDELIAWRETGAKQPTVWRKALRSLLRLRAD